MSQTFHDLIRRQQKVEKSGGRFYTPDQPETPETPWTALVWQGVKRRFHGQQRPERRGERVISGRQPTFLDVVINRAAGREVRQEDAYDRATETDYDKDVADLLAALDALDEEQTKSYNEVRSGDYISKSSGLNISRIARNAVAEVMEKAGL